MLFVLLSILTAGASPVFPTTIQGVTESECAPPCTICHETNAGGSGTITTDFGILMLDRGLGSSDFTLMMELLDELEADGTDTDGDGIPDFDELANSFDPNPDGELYCDIDSPVYGCLNHAPTGLPGLGLALGLALALARRRK